MENNILVLGNGFDIAHGLKTKYEDFMDWVRGFNGNYSNLDIEDYDFKMRLDSNGFLEFFLEYTNAVSGWVDLEYLIKSIIDHFRKFLSDYIDIVNDIGEINIQKRYKLAAHICVFPLFQRSSSPMIYKLDKRYFDVAYGLNKGEVLKILKGQLDDINQLLRIYLNKCTKLEVSSSGLTLIDQIKNIDISHVITFNYTDTYRIYGIDSKDVLHIHGSIEQDNMVLGFDDDDPKELDFIYFKKYFQRVQKLTGYFDYELLGRNKQGIVWRPTIHFYGLSMNKTDGDMIRDLWDLSPRFVIYYLDPDDYAQKVINLIDIFGKDIITEIQKQNITFIQCQT